MLYPDFKELMEIGARSAGVSLTARRKAVSVITGDYKSPFRGRGLEFEEVRAYVLGDDVRNIDWRVTARTGQPHLKLYSEDRERSVLVSVDCNESMRFGTRGTFKSIQAARAAALIGWAAVHENNRFGASLYGNVPEGQRFFGPRRSRRSLWRMFRLLCDTQDYNKQPVALEDHLQYLGKAVPSGSLIFIIGDFMDLGLDLKKRLADLHARADVVLIAVNDPADGRLEKAGTIVFSGGNQERLIIDTDDREGSRAYERSWKHNRHMLDEMVKSLGLGFVQLYTNRDVRTDLILGLRLIRKIGGRGAGSKRTASAAD
ncbi:MAG: DUF58 domain-containing protein [Rhodospirillales bacterium]|nr:DUF58 domain-containing protein [Alphaproteobacteria bacterium]MCB1840525.1 DUF58 domain-containing protein [Alphaproteobacteria bacterium]MCB9977129.1 DUF58 domain-containing protein [Rhodospirillales bacterium]